MEKNLTGGSVFKNILIFSLPYLLSYLLQTLYRRLLAYIAEHKLKISGFSREITMIDYGLTNDLSKFVTEISIPVE